jgi:exonuclease SbcD
MTTATQPADLPPKPAGAYRVVHTADWHLGKPLGEESREPEQQAFLRFLQAQIHTHEVDALLIAGDVFDTANPPQSAVKLYYDFLSSLYAQRRCQVIVTAGNHDSPGQLEAPREVLKALQTHIVGNMPGDAAAALVWLPDRQAPRLVVAAIPYLRERDLRLGTPGETPEAMRQAVQEGITRRYAEALAAAAPAIARGVPVIAMGHLMADGDVTFQGGRETHVGGLDAVTAETFPAGFAYVALGHLHTAQAISRRETVRYSGAPLVYSFGDRAVPKSVRVLDFTAEGALHQYALPIPPTRQVIELRAPWPELRQRLTEFMPPLADLPAWVMVTVLDAPPGENLPELVHELTAGRGYQVLRVKRETSAQPGALTAEGPIDEAAVDALLDDPRRVFALRLAAEPAFSDTERTALTAAFQELLTGYHEALREPPAASAGDAP